MVPKVISIEIQALARCYHDGNWYVRAVAKTRSENSASLKAPAKSPRRDLPTGFGPAMGPALVAQAVREVPTSDAAKALQHLPINDAADVVEHLPVELAAGILAQLEPETAGPILAHMKISSAAPVLHV